MIKSVIGGFESQEYLGKKPQNGVSWDNFAMMCLYLKNSYDWPINAIWLQRALKQAELPNAKGKKVLFS